MRAFDEYEGEMQTPGPLDDTTVNLLLAGSAVGGCFRSAGPS